MYQDTVTVFNRRGEMWYPTVLHGVDLNVDKAAIVSKFGAQCNDRALLHVRYDWDGGAVVGGKPYLTPKIWQGLEDPGAAITFTSGEKFDFFIEGEWPEPGPVDDGAYGAKGFYDYINRTRDGVYAITSVSRFSVIHHFEVTGK